MAVTRRLLATDNNQDCQILKVDSSKRYLVNDTEDWQFMFGPNSDLTTSTQIAKIGAEFNINTFNSINMVAYLFNTLTGSVDNSGDCVFKIYKVDSNSTWNDVLLTTINGTLQNNNYYFASELITNLSGATLDGMTTLMIEVSMVRLGNIYKDRLYINHLGVVS